MNRALYLPLVGALAALILLTMPGTQARADPTVAQIEAQINQIWTQAEPLIESYDAVHEQYVKNKAQQAALEKKVEPLQRQVELGQLRIGVIAASVYMGGQANVLNALTSGSPQTFVDQLSFIDQLARGEEQQLAGVSNLKQQFDAQMAPLNKLVSDLAVQDSDLAAKKKVIDNQLDQLQKLREKAYGNSSGTGSDRPWPCPTAYEPTAGYRAAKYACAQAGVAWYRIDASGGGYYDCSGLTMAAWASVGVSLPHNAAAQHASVKIISRAQLQLGDLVFYYSGLSHVAIYVGDNKVVHASQPGERVKMVDMDGVAPINSYGRPS